MDEALSRSKPHKSSAKVVVAFVSLTVLLVVLFFLGLFVGSSNMSLGESIRALFGDGTNTAVRIVQQIRLPRVIAAVLAGGGLAVAGLIMQTTLGNEMASPSTLGVSSAAVFGANVSIIGFAGEFIVSRRNYDTFLAAANPFSISSFAFLFAILSVILVLALSKFARFNPTTIILAGIGIGAIWTAATTLLQYMASDISLSAAVTWSFGDLGRATFQTDWIMLGVIGVALICFILLSWRYNAMLSGEEVASSLGIKTGVLRIFSLILASLIIAAVISFLGIIGFIGIIAPHIAKRLLGFNHRVTIPCSFLLGSVLVLGADTITRAFSGGTSFPIGAITTLLGAPFFLYLIFAKKGARHD